MAICKYLKLAVQIAAGETQTRQLIDRLYNLRPALPALEDEMRKVNHSSDNVSTLVKD